MELLGGKPTDEQKLEGLIGFIEQRLQVSAANEGTISMTIDWPDPRLAYELVQTALQRFLQNRQVSESSAIAESVTILERYAESMENEVNATVAALQAAQARRPRPPLPAIAPVRNPVVAAAAVAFPALNLPSAQSSEVERLGAVVEAKRAEVARVEDGRRQQLAALQAKLATGLTIYTEDHPAIVALRQNVESLSLEPAQLNGLRTELHNLEAAYDLAVAKLQEEQERAERQQRAAAAAGSEPATSTEPKSAATAATRRPVAAPSATTAEAPTASYSAVDETNPVSLRLRLQLNELSNIRSRIDGAKIELATSQAAFKYRYAIIRPPQMPRAPIKPNVPAILLAGVIGSVLLAVAAAVVMDLLTGRVLEPWQVERQIGVPILGSVRSL
jgi:hypothetical protein